MGYYTYFSMSVDGASDDDISKIVSAMKEKDIIPYIMDENFSSSGIGAMWDDNEEDMIELSLQFPHVHFIVHGEGDERSDVWDNHYLNGMTQELYAEIVMPPFDPNGWQESEYAQNIRVKTQELPEFDADNQSLTSLLEVET